MYNKYLDEMKKSDLKEAIKSEIKSILTEAVGEKLDDNSSKADELSTKIDDIEGKLEEEELKEALNPEVVSAVNRLIKGMAKKYGYEEKDAVFAIQAALKQREFDNPTFADIRKKEEPKAADIKKKKSIAKEKEDALKTKEKIDKIKKDLKKNKSELLKISKIDRKERTKAEQSLFDSMVDKTKELKKLEKSL